MMHSFRIGKLFGIEIRIDSSWLFIFVLLTWNLTTVFSGWHSDWSPFESFAIALTASLLFFACILLHELAHSLVAGRHGLRVRSITLFLFGGVSNIEHEPPSAGAEFLIAIVGPITSILLGAAFLGIAVATSAISVADVGGTWTGYAHLGPLETLLAWLGPMNLTIGVFNLVPAFPLDGGRVLRSILWSMNGNLALSTRRVSAVGQVIGWLFIVAGLEMTFGLRIVFFGTGLESGLWLAFIGWFLRTAASQSYKRLAIDEALAGHSVEEIMRRDGPTIAPELPLSIVVSDYLVHSDARALPVVRDGQLLGLVSMSEVRTTPQMQWLTTPAGSVMRPRSALAVVSPHDPLTDAFVQLAQRDVAQLPVLDHGRLVGMLHRRDIARRLELAWDPIVAQGVHPATSRGTIRPPLTHPSTPERRDEPHARST